VKVAQDYFFGAREIDFQMQHIVKHGVTFKPGIKEYGLVIPLEYSRKTPLAKATVVRNIGGEHGNFVRVS
jgi:hypothetical protein